jgi:hypothetical protein
MQASSGTNTASNAAGQLSHLSLLDVMRGRRSRRFGVGMKIPDGPISLDHKACFAAARRWAAGKTLRRLQPHPCAQPSSH